jgi:glycosyltransferase involved in cell wall biosynthesis
MAKLIKSYGVKVPIEILPTGINPEDFHPISTAGFRQKYNIRQNGKLLLFVGRLGEEKNIRFLLKSFAEILKQIDLNLILVGSGPSISDYKKFVKEEGIEDKVYFLGFLPKVETNKIFGACDLFVFPSLTDTQGIVIIEAMAAGLVPVAMNKLGPSDIITDGFDGVLSKLDHIDFRKNIIKLLTDDVLRQKLANNAKKTAEKYSQEKITQKLITLYELTKETFDNN